MIAIFKMLTVALWMATLIECLYVLYDIHINL